MMKMTTYQNKMSPTLQNILNNTRVPSLNLYNILDISDGRNKIGISEERIEAIKPYLRQYIAHWREYPDLFIDFMVARSGKNCNFKLFFYQRVFLRVAIRYKYVYCVYPRA